MSLVEKLLKQAAQLERLALASVRHDRSHDELLVIYLPPGHLRRRRPGRTAISPLTLLPRLSSLASLAACAGNAALALTRQELPVLAGTLTRIVAASDKRSTVESYDVQRLVLRSDIKRATRSRNKSIFARSSQADPILVRRRLPSVDDSLPGGSCEGDDVGCVADSSWLVGLDARKLSGSSVASRWPRIARIALLASGSSLTSLPISPAAPLRPPLAGGSGAAWFTFLAGYPHITFGSYRSWLPWLPRRTWLPAWSWRSWLSLQTLLTSFPYCSRLPSRPPCPGRTHLTCLTIRSYHPSLAGRTLLPLLSRRAGRPALTGRPLRSHRPHHPALARRASLSRHSRLTRHPTLTSCPSLASRPSLSLQPLSSCRAICTLSSILSIAKRRESLGNFSQDLGAKRHHLGTDLGYCQP